MKSMQLKIIAVLVIVLGLTGWYAKYKTEQVAELQQTNKSLQIAYEYVADQAKKSDKLVAEKLYEIEILQAQSEKWESDYNDIIANQKEWAETPVPPAILDWNKRMLNKSSKN